MAISQTLPGSKPESASGGYYRRSHRTLLGAVALANSGDRDRRRGRFFVADSRMNLLVLYLLLCKAMLTSFSGPTSLPVVQSDMVDHYHAISNHQLTAAVAAGRATPGPFGLYIVSVGYFVAGVPGAIVGLLAVLTPAFLIIPMLQYLGHRVNRGRSEAPSGRSLWRQPDCSSARQYRSLMMF